jgi:predicted nuclease with TOPRIM domain
LTFGRKQRDHFYSMDDYSVVAEELSLLGAKIRDLDDRLAEVERVNARLEDAALTTARAMAEISHHWDAVYEAMRRAETTATSTMSERDNAAARARRSSPSDSSEPPRTDD